MGLKQARYSDTTDHGGQIITGDAIRFTEGLKVARRGDLIACPEHGIIPIITAISSPLLTSGPDTAHFTSQGSCGCQIITGSKVTFHEK